MAARKLQAEIDRTLKKVAEGVELFEGLYEKLQLSSNQTQKEKLESDLKTQIKKLQRLRDQIKTWLQSNDIKDKKPLLDNRKLIETQMEKFKACEKEMKTKAFSKEGLIAAARLDPTEKAKVEMSNWLSSMVDELSRQVEAAEAEIEVMAGSGKKGKKGGAKDERASELDHQNERRNWHISRLEILLRMLENGSLDTDRVADIKDDISYFVESNAEEDFDEDEGIYDEFNLDDEEEAFGLKVDDDATTDNDTESVAESLPPKTPVKDLPTKARRDSESEHKKEDHPATTASNKKAASRKVSADTQVNKDKVIPPANFAQAKPPPVSNSAVTSPPKAPAAAPLPPIRYAAAAAAAVAPAAQSLPPHAAAPAPAAAAANASAPPQSQDQSQDQSQTITSSPKLSSSATGEVASPAPSHTQSTTGSQAESAKVSSAAQSQAEASPAAPTERKTTSPAPPGLGRAPGAPANGPSAAKDAESAAKGSPSAGSSSLRQSTTPSSPSVSHASAPGASEDGGNDSKPAVGYQNAQLAASSAAAGVVQPVGGGAGTPQQQQAAQRQQGTETRLPSSLTDLVSSFESAKQKSMRRDSNLSGVHKSLENSFISFPEPVDSDKPKYYVPKNPYPTPAYYPQTPHHVFDNPALYSKFDVDTLFYIFYYQQGTYHQFLAARELKKQSWRFHKQYLTWFQRHSEPQAITDEYEQGVYVYFDWEGSWCQRKKSDFRFEYRWLEEN
ncbi:hypothetical protein IE53DRAFT_389026 [Violaceomyces palustris]|uniref:Uncharacterized protein n=1 Tax=Violaceomyces palustris TaxID=1673888 RepID=A0ACD0NSE9_9BASI|nr:hypothetical protein IE53DRAFT_389026 [Violaceomyces palustris]